MFRFALVFLTVVHILESLGLPDVDDGEVKQLIVAEVFFGRGGLSQPRARCHAM